MTWYDRLLVRVAWAVWKLLGRRFSERAGRVFYLSAGTSRPRTAGGRPVPKLGLVCVGFGAEGNVARVVVTREQLDQLRDGISKATTEQDAHYAVVEG